jgi:hypothetical protein
MSRSASARRAGETERPARRRRAAGSIEGRAAHRRAARPAAGRILGHAIPELRLGHLPNPFLLRKPD